MAGDEQAISGHRLTGDQHIVGTNRHAVTGEISANTSSLARIVAIEIEDRKKQRVKTVEILAFASTPERAIE